MANGIEYADAGQPADMLRKGLVGAVGLIAGALLFALVLLVAHSNAERDAAHDRERHSYTVLVTVRAVESSMMRAEAELGRYVINGRRETGTLYYDAWRQAGGGIARLARLTADNPEQVALVAELRDAYLRRGAELGAPATRAFYKQGWAALSLFDKAGRSPTIGEIATLLAQIERNEMLILDQRSNRAVDRTDWSNRLSRLLSGMGLVIGLSAVLLGWLVYGTIQQRSAAREAAVAEAERAEQLEWAVIDRTRELREVNEKLRAEAATRAEAEAQLHQVQKMEAVGQLTGGIAHDFNNMLAVVVGALDLARRRLATPDEAERFIDSAMEGANRAASLTRRLLSFSRAEALLPSAVFPARLIAGMSDLLDRTLGERIRLETKGEEVDWQVWIDPHQFENAILNLAVNARDAMDGEGTLRIVTGICHLAAGEARGLPAGDYVRIGVADTGCGMDPLVLERAFEPFFTTKPVGKGTGLGLAQVFGFARQSGGEVTISSEPGIGTEVALYLPRHEACAETGAGDADIETNEADLVHRVQNLRVLLVEDDPRVRASTAAALQELGHQPRVCASGDEALTELSRRADVDLLVTDVVMPGMTGTALAATLAAQGVAIPILLVSGYAGEAGETVDLTGHELLRKPFTVGQLGQAIEAVFRRRLSAPRHRAEGAAEG